MSDTGYSTVIDAVLFLLFVSASALVLSPSILGHATERSLVDGRLRELSADVLLSLKTERIDLFEYRILGDVADRIAEEGDVNATNDVLYRQVTAALLGRGSRHKTPLEIAAEDAACQFAVRYGENVQRLNPVTVEYDHAASSLIDRSIRAKLDDRYGYEFTLRWSPFTGVPLEGEVKAGRPCPPAAASAQTYVTVPYTTNITVKLVEKVNTVDLERMAASIEQYQVHRDNLRLGREIMASLEGCLRNTTREEAREIWDRTLGSLATADPRLDPLRAMKRFSNNETLNERLLLDICTAGEGLVESLALTCGREELDRLTAYIVEGIVDGSLDTGRARQMTVAWLKSRYEPSRALATVSVWVEPHDP